MCVVGPGAKGPINSLAPVRPDRLDRRRRELGLWNSHKVPRPGLHCSTTQDDVQTAVGRGGLEVTACNRSKTYISGALLADHGASWGQEVGTVCSLWLRDGLQQGPPGDRILVAKAAVVYAEKGRFSAALWVSKRLLCAGTDVWTCRSSTERAHWRLTSPHRVTVLW